MIPLHVSFAKLRRGNKLCFYFHGTSKAAVMAALLKLSSLYSTIKVTTEHLSITNGKCPYNIVATITDPKTDTLPETEWPMMVSRFLQQESGNEVTYFDKYDAFLNT